MCFSLVPELNFERLTSTTEELDEDQPHVRCSKRIEASAPAEVLLFFLKLSIPLKRQQNRFPFAIR
jgi:hypothetical protein